LEGEVGSVEEVQREGSWRSAGPMPNAVRVARRSESGTGNFSSTLSASWPARAPARVWCRSADGPAAGGGIVRSSGPSCSGCRSQHLQQPGSGPLDFVRGHRGPGVDDLGELPWGQDLAALERPGAARPAAVDAQQRPDRDAGPAVERLGDSFALPAQPAQGPGRAPAPPGSRPRPCPDPTTQTPLGPTTRWSRLSSQPGRVTSCNTR
jgi:hypothetical protein